jgi:uncharacterized protein YbbC (DUF1343 family)
MRVRIGIEVLLRDRLPEFQGARLGAVVHPASVLPDLRHTADVIRLEWTLNLRALFGPQHGARGELQDNMIESEFYVDPDTKLPVHSLYGATRRPSKDMLRDVDMLLYDLQDVGTRVYTFIHTMAFCMQSCEEYGKRMVILDRPNPVNGIQVEGNLLQPDYASFVGLYPIPMRHGMTAGEMALMLNEEFGIHCDLEVVPMEGWRRDMWFDQTGLPWIQPSPNLPTLDSASVYPGMVLVEGTGLSEGRGTTRPFEYVGAPFIQPATLAGSLREMRLPGVFFRPAYFQPTFHKWAGQMCGGVQLHITNRECFEPYLTGISVLSAVRSLYPADFKWRQPPYEYEYGKLPIEILCGGPEVPRQIEQAVPPEQVRASWQTELARFLDRRAHYLLY